MAMICGQKINPLDAGLGWAGKIGEKRFCREKSFSAS